MKKIKLILTTIIIILSLTSTVEARTLVEYYKWRIKIKLEAIKIQSILIRRIEQNKNKIWKHLKQIPNLNRG